MAGRIDQMLSGFAQGDAISGEALLLRDLFRAWGAASEIYADPAHTSSEVRTQCRPLTDYAGGPTDVLIHHYAIASVAVERFAEARAAKVLLYHNITPAAFYAPYDPAVAGQLASAREALPRVLARADAVWADSRFNASELEALGARGVAVLPLIFSPDRFDAPPSAATLARFAAPLVNVLFVGRMAPNKCVEELLQAFAWYHRTLNPQSRLILIGSEQSAWRYAVMLRLLAAELDVPTVYFESHASREELSAFYDLATVFVTCSRHEGYCLPLVEAMHRGVPVVARRTGGTPEALGGAGVLYDEAGARELAALIQRVAADAVLRAEILASQRRRMDELRARRPDDELRALLARWL